MSHPVRIWVILVFIAGLWCPLIASAAAEYVEGEVIVTFKTEATEAAAKTSLGRRSLAFTRRFGWLSSKRGKQTGLVRSAAKTTEQLILELKDDPTVETVEPNYLRRVNASPNDARFGDMWGLNNSGQTVGGIKGTSGSDIKFPAAWDMARVTSQEVVVGVIDTGVEFVHPDLQENMWVNRGERLDDEVDNDGDGYTNDYHGYDFIGNNASPTDSGNHGTHVAGTIAAIGNNGTGIIGVNSRAKIMALKVSSDGDSISTSAVIEALQYATMMKTRGVNIVALNASYGGGGSSNAEKAAIQAAGNAGIILCAAAGNDSANNDVKQTYPASYRLSNMIVVAATDQNDALANFSNYGATTVDIAAPGKNVLSLAPSGVAVKIGDQTYETQNFQYAATTSGITGNVYFCGLGNPEDFPAEVRGHIALIERGSFNFSVKVTNAMAAGATAALIYNNIVEDDTASNWTLGGPGKWIPARFLSKADGLAIRAALPASASMVPSGNYQYMNGTSMATPHVTGAVAFAAMNFPNESVTQRIQRILSSVDTKSSLSTKVRTRGRLNLLRTVDANLNGVADWMDRSGPDAPTITTATPLLSGAVSFAYSETLTATGGTAPYAWSLVSGALPPGLTLSGDGVLAGVPTTPGLSEFVVQVKDSTQASSALPITLEIAATPLAISSPEFLTDGKVGVVYAGALTTTGGTPTYIWSVISGTLPSGMSLSSSGQWFGAPTAMGTYEFVAQVTDGSQEVISQPFTLVVGPAPLTIVTEGPITVGALGVHYIQAFLATGGIGARTWTISEGGLPSGLAFFGNGMISGVPTSKGTYFFTLKVVSGVDVQTKAFTITIQQTPVIITTASPLTAGVKGLPGTYPFALTGGTAPYYWTHIAGNLPDGMTFTSAGVLSGKPTKEGTFAFTIAAADSIGFVVARTLTLTITASYVKPVVDVVNLGATTVGMHYSKAVTAANYPKSFSIRNLPPGLKYAAATGLISGRPTVAGDFDVEIKATNSGGTSDVVIFRLSVAAIPEGFIGSFTGIIGRNEAANGNLGGRLILTTTAKGHYTAKITVGSRTKSLVGYLVDTAPHLRGEIDVGLLFLTFDKSKQLVSGTCGGAVVNGWRSTWSRGNPADTRAGYYTVGIDLADEGNQGAPEIPQGSGYASFTVTAAGGVAVGGKAADGTAFTSSGFMGPQGQIALYRPLYGNLGSIVGTLVLTEDPNQISTDNVVSGKLTWLKPVTKTRVYPSAFGPIDLAVYGKYLAMTATKGIVTSGLPVSGTANLIFAGGGVEGSETRLNVSPFTFTTTKKVALSPPGLWGNPAKVTLSINTKTGLIGGAFTLHETSPVLTRRVTFQGMVIRPASGSSKARGYFLLPQIPDPGKPLSSASVLSGKVLIDQSAAE